MPFLFRCEKFKRLLHDASPDLQRIVEERLRRLEKMEKLGATGSITPYPNQIFVLEIVSKYNSRIIIQRENISTEFGDTSCYFVRDIIFKSQFVSVWSAYVYSELSQGRWSRSNPISEEDRMRAINLYNELYARPQTNDIPPQLQTSLTAWVSETTTRKKIEFVVYETEDWVKFSEGTNLTDSMGNLNPQGFLDLITDIVRDNTHKFEQERIETASAARNLWKATRGSVCVVYEDSGLLTEDETTRIVLLHNGATLPEQQQHLINAIDCAKTIQPLDQNGQYTQESIADAAIKAYAPGVLLRGNDWLSIQKNTAASNLALSPEQTTLLEKFTFPKFINGQAGSGKSTMLYYLFGNICLNKILNDELEGEPLFLTENPELVRRTQEQVENLLIANGEYSGWGLSENEIQRHTHVYFHSYRKFFIEKFIDDPQQFTEDKYINFAVFRQLYIESYLPEKIKRKYSPEIAWFVISTFIKGYYPDKYLTPKMYEEEVSRKDKGGDKGISVEDYSEIYAQIWEKFYAKKTANGEGYWDRIDLARTILTMYPKELPYRYPVIFCDETQDFTKVEIELIFKLSEFVGYDLANVEQIPIVFAGDPNQTLNPAGFNPDRIKDLFFSELEQKYHFTPRNEYFYPLAYNYRSAAGVVQMANLVQLFRRKFLGMKIDTPQKAKRKDGSTTKPRLFSVDSWETQENRTLLEKLKNDVFVLACNENEEEEARKAKTHLQKVNLHSAIRVKGAEYERVVVHGFGADFYETFRKSLNEVAKQDNGNNYELRFFLNKLYVAITRAQKQLVIIDTVEGVGCFWEHFINEDFIRGQQSDSKFSGITFADVYTHGSIGELDASDLKTRRKNAEVEKTTALANRDAALMDSVAVQYEILGEMNEAQLCRALSKEYSRKWEDAANFYHNILRHDDALRCYWLGGVWDKLQYSTLSPSASKRNSLALRKTIARLMTDDRQLRIADLLAHDKNTWETGLFESGEYELVAWRDPFLRKIQQFLLREMANCKPDEYAKVAETLVALNNRGAHRKELNSLAGQYFYRAKWWNEAIEQWEFADEITDDYYRAQVEVANTTEEKIRAYALMRFPEHAAIVREYERKAVPITDTDLLKVIFVACVAEEFYEKTLSKDFQEVFDLSRIIRHAAADEKVRDRRVSTLLQTALQYPQIVTPEFVATIGKYTTDVRFLKAISYAPVNTSFSDAGTDWVSRIANSNLSLKEQLCAYERLAAKSDVLNFIQVSVLAQPNQKSEDYAFAHARWIKHSRALAPDFETWKADYQQEAKNWRVAALGINDAQIAQIPEWGFPNSEAEKRVIDAIEQPFYLTQISIRNFRRFKQLDIANIGQFNLILGDNNVGKTSLLEALMFDEDVNVWADRLLYLQTVRSQGNVANLYEGAEILKPFLRKHADTGDSPISLEYLQGGAVKELALSARNGHLLLNGAASDSVEALVKDRIHKNALHPFVPFGKGFGDDSTRIFENSIYNTDIDLLESELLPSLRLFIPNLRDIRVGKDGIMMYETGNSRGIELHSYGEGANKLFRILLQIAEAKGGRLMIDEIDAGIHYRKFAEFWRIVLLAAKTNNVQLFATTHNDECILYFIQALEMEDVAELQSKARVITLRKVKEDIKTSVRRFEEFSDPVEDMRGGRER